MENNNLYVNAGELMELLGCMKQRNLQYHEILTEVEELILDLKWKEIKDEQCEKKSA